MHEVCHKSYEINCLKSNVKILGIKPAVQLEACNVAHNMKQSETQSIQCVPHNHEVNNGVFVECVIKMDTRIVSKIMPNKLCIKLQKSAREMYEKLKRAYEDQTWSQGQVFDGTMTVWKSRMQLKMNHIQEDLSRKQQMKTNGVAYVEVLSTLNIETDSRSI